MCGKLFSLSEDGLFEFFLPPFAHCSEEIEMSYLVTAIVEGACTHMSQSASRDQRAGSELLMTKQL